MPSINKLPEGIEVPDGWVCEMHNRLTDALVWFSPAIIRVFTDYDSRHTLMGAVGGEINTIPSTVIPYGTIEFRNMLFELRPVFRTVCLLTLRGHFPSHIFDSLFWRFVADA